MTTQTTTRNGDLFHEALIRSYIDAPRFVQRTWLWQHVQAALNRPHCRFVLLTAEPGAGKTAFMAWLAGQHPDWPRYFIRRDQRTALEDGGARGFLEKIGFQLAARFPEVFHTDAVRLSVSQAVDTSSGQVTGADVDRLVASPFYTKAFDIIQEVKTNQGNVTGIHVRELVTDPNRISLLDLQRMALLAPAMALQRLGRIEPLVILIDALDELRYRALGDTVLDWLTQCPELPANMRILVTSRSEPEWLAAFRSAQQDRLMEEIIPQVGEDIRRDLTEYAGKLAAIPEVASSLVARKQPGQLTQKASDQFVANAVEKAKGNIGYLDAVGRAIDQALANNDQALLVGLLELRQLPDTLQDLYGHFLKLLRQSVGDQSVVVEDPVSHKQGLVKAWANVYRPVLGVLAVAMEPLTPAQIWRLGHILAEVDDVSEAIGRLRQFLHEQGGRYTFYHTTLPEFLEAETTRQNPQYQEMAVDPAMWHKKIVTSYRGQAATWDQVNWRAVDNYGLSHLAGHLYALRDDPEDREELYKRLFGLVRSPSWYQAQIALDPSGTTYRNDLSYAKALAEARDAEDIQHGRLATHLGQEVWFALAMSSLGSRSQGIPPALLKALVTSGKWSWIEALATARQTPEPNRKAQALCALVPLLPPELGHGVIEEGLLAAEKSPFPWSQAEMRLALAAHLPEVERYRIEQETLDTILRIDSEGQRTDTLAWVAPLLPKRMLAKALQATRKIEGAYNQEKVLVALAPRLSKLLLRQALSIRSPEAMQCRPAIMAAQAAYLPPADRLPLLRQALQETQAIEDLTWKGVAVRALAPHLPESLLRKALTIAQRLAPFSSHYRDDALEAVATCLANMGDGTSALDAIQSMWIDFYRPRTLATIAPHLSQDQLQQVLVIAQGIQDPYWKAEAAGLLVSYAPEHEQSSILLQALADLQIDDTDDRTMSLATLAIYLPEARQREALAALRQIKDHFWRSEALVALAPHLPDALIEEAYNLAVGLNDDKYEIRAVTALAPRLSPHILEQAFSRNRFFDGQRRRQIMQALAPYLPEPLLHQAFQDAQELTDSDNQMTVLIALVPFLPELLLRQALNTARRMEENDALKSARLLTAIALRLSESEQSPVLDEVLQIFRQVPDSYLLAAPDWAALVTCLVKKARFQEALHWMRRIQDGTWHANTIAGILPLLPADWVPHLRPATERITDWPAQVRVLAQLGQHMSENPLYEVVTRVVNFSQAHPRPERARAFVPLLPHLPSAMRLQVLNHTVDLIREIQDLNSHSQVLCALGAYLLTDRTALPLGKLHELWHNLLPKIAQLNRNELLGHLRNLAAIITILGGVEAVQESFRAIQEAGQWWP